MTRTVLLMAALLTVSWGQAQKKYSKSFIKKQKAQVEALVEARHKNTQVMVDKIFSFAELGFHEVASSQYLTETLKAAGFEIVYGVSDIPRPGLHDGPTVKGL